jgi:hypothetical protein
MPAELGLGHARPDSEGRVARGDTPGVPKGLAREPLVTAVRPFHLIELDRGQEQVSPEVRGIAVEQRAQSPLRLVGALGPE